MASAAPPTEDFNTHIKSTALLTSATCTLDDAQRYILHEGFTFKAIFTKGVSLNYACNARRPTNLCMARLKKAHWIISAFLQAAMIPARYQAYVFLSVGLQIRK